MVAGAFAGQAALAPDADAGTLGLTAHITGAGTVTAVEGGSYSCTNTNQDDRVTIDCARQTFGAVFEAWVWLRATPSTTPTGNWRFVQWVGCDETRVVLGEVQCGVHSGAFSLDERNPRAVFDDFVSPTMTSLDALQSLSYDRTFTFTGTADNQPTGYQCAVDGGPYADCSPTTTRSFAEGYHTFWMRAGDASGNWGAGRAVDFWSIDTVITGGPTGLTTSASPSFTFSSVGGQNFACSLDYAAFTACGTGHSGSRNYSGLSDGSHVFRVYASNGNDADRLAAYRSFTVDTVPPGTSLTSIAASGRSATFAFSGTDASAYQCQLTGPTAQSWTTCGSPQSYAGLADGDYVFAVRASDAAGNVDPSPATHGWTVDTTSPQTTITAGPANRSFLASTTADLTLTSSEANSWLACSLDGSPVGCAGGSAHLTGLIAGTHVFRGAAADDFGNTDSTPAQRSWTVPVDDTALTHGTGWQLRNATTAFRGTYSQSTTQGARLTTSVSNAKRLALVATKGVGYGKVSVYLGNTLLKTINLADTSTHNRAIIPLVTFPSPTSGTVKVVVASSGKQVRIDGLGAAT